MKEKTSRTRAIKDGTSNSTPKHPKDPTTKFGVKPKDALSVQLWVKSEVLTFGALQVPPHHRIVFDNLKKLIDYAFVKKQQDFPKLRFTLWRHVACDKLGMAPEVAWIYFETYDMLRDDATPQLRKTFDEASFTRGSENVAGVDSADTIDGAHGSSSSSRDDIWVDVRRFAILLGVQRIHKISLRTSLSMGDEWPSTGQPPSSPRPQPPPPHSARLPFVPDADACLAFFSGYLKNFLDLLLSPTRANPQGSGVDPSLSLEAVEALGFLIGAKVIDRERKTETLVNLHEVATYPNLHTLTGYSKATNSFAYRPFEDWFRASLVADPFAAPAISLTGLHLPWITSPHEASARSSSRATPYQIVSNFNLSPRPREKLLHVSNVVKQALARSDEDENLFRASVRLHRVRDSFCYFLTPLRSVLISKCKNVVIFCVAETTVHLTSCENATVIACCRRLSVAHSKRCTFHLLTPSSPLVLGFNEELTFAPFNTSYPGLDRHLQLCDLGVSVNSWDRPYVMGGTEGETKAWNLMPPENFTTTSIPFEKAEGKEDEGKNRGALLVKLPKDYQEALEEKARKFAALRQQIVFDGERLKSERQAQELNKVLRRRFFDWLIAGGNHKELRSLALCKAEKATSG